MTLALRELCPYVPRQQANGKRRPPVDGQVPELPAGAVEVLAAD